MKSLLTLLFACFQLTFASVRFGAGTACADKDGKVLGEVECIAAPKKIVAAKTGAVAQVSRQAAGEFIEACFKTFGEGNVHQVGRKLYDGDVEFVAYTVDEGASQVPLNNSQTLKRYKKLPPPPPPPKEPRNSSAAMKISWVLLGKVILLCL